MSALLDHLYQHMPSLPALVYFARKMNMTQKKVTDSKENTLNSMIATMNTVAVIDFEILEYTHLEYVKGLQEKKAEQEKTPQKEEKREVPQFLKDKAELVHEQLALINSLDQKLTQALKGLDNRIREVKNSLGEGTNMADMASGMIEAGDVEDGGFESLFSDQPLWDRLPPPDPPVLPERIALTRSIAAPTPPLIRSQAVPPAAEKPSKTLNI